METVKTGYSIITETYSGELTLSPIGRRVYVPEYGFGFVKNLEVFPCGSTSTRFGIVITDEINKIVLKSLFPDNLMYFWSREFVYTD